jgi:hypothetical protein
MANELKDHADEAGVHWNDVSKKLELKDGGATPSKLSFAVTAAAQTVLDDATTTEMLATLGGGSPATLGTFASGGGAAINVDVSTHANYGETDTLTAALAVTLTNGDNTKRGTLYFQQDATGRAVTIVAAGRTVKMVGGVAIPATANALFLVNYAFVTLNAVDYLVLEAKTFT